MKVIDNKGFIESDKIKVFPCAFRGVNINGVGVNPEAKLNTEYTYTHLYSQKTELIEFNAQIIRFAISGYYFEITNGSKDVRKAFNSLLEDDGDELFAHIKLKDQTIGIGTSTSCVTKRLDNLYKTTDTSLDSTDNTTTKVGDSTIENYYFGGILFDTNSENDDYDGTICLGQLIDNGTANKRIKALPMNKQVAIKTSTAEGAVELNNPILNENDTILNTARGERSIAAGYGTEAFGNYSVAIGSYNANTNDKTLTGQANPVFSVGGGNSSGRNNLFEVNGSGDVGIKNDLIIKNNLKVEGGDNSTKTSNGAVTVAGGVGVEKDVIVGGGIFAAGNSGLNGVLSISNATAASSNSGALITRGGIRARNAYFEPSGVTITSSSTTVGKLIFNDNAWIGAAGNDTTPNANSLYLRGGDDGIILNASCANSGSHISVQTGGANSPCDRLTIYPSSNSSTGSTSGTLRVSGGIYTSAGNYFNGSTTINGNASITGKTSITNTTAASPTDGALKVSGGINTNGIYSNSSIVIKNETASLRKLAFASSVWIAAASSDNSSSASALYLRGSDNGITLNAYSSGIYFKTGGSSPITRAAIYPSGEASTNATSGTLRVSGGIYADAGCYFNGDIKADGTVYALSDIRKKENVTSYAPKKSILDLDVKEFDYKDSKKHTIGCIAQDLQEICPEIVEEGDDGYLAIAETKIVYLLLDEVKKLRQEIDELKSK